MKRHFYYTLLRIRLGRHRDDFISLPPQHDLPHLVEIDPRTGSLTTTSCQHLSDDNSMITTSPHSVIVVVDDDAATIQLPFCIITQHSIIAAEARHVISPFAHSEDKCIVVGQMEDQGLMGSREVVSVEGVRDDRSG